jgi:hypothetical protein
MKICPQCFSDSELKAFISTSTQIGNCGVCSSENVPIIDIIELFDFFQELIENFQKTEAGESLKSKIQGNWSFFTSHDVATQILNNILAELTTDISSAEDNVNYVDEIVENYGYWEELKDKLKWSNRFFFNTGYLEDLGWDSFFNTQYELTGDIDFYRARVHHLSGLSPYETHEMMCPNREISSGGRANPVGIPFLYLCDNPETVLYEVRASYLDELSIGKFHLNRDISSVKIVDFTEDTFLFQPNRVNTVIKARLLRDKISQDLSKPMRRYDTEIEYIPTQFICEFIKVYTGASGIRFRSSLHPSGKNIVLFDQSLMSCSEVSLTKVTSLKLKSNHRI